MAAKSSLILSLSGMKRTPPQLAILIAVLLLAHEWYPNQCCGGHDCLEVPCAAVAYKHGYWEYLPKHVTFNAAQASPDNYCHVCINDANIGLCLFVPQENS